MTLESGFPGERISVLPRPRLRAAKTDPLTAQLLVSDAGYFPRAASHLRVRPRGSEQAIIIVCTSGTGWCELPGGEVVLQPGHALVLPAGTPHRYGADTHDPWTVWWLHLTGTAVPDLLSAADVGADGAVLVVSDVSRAVALVNEALSALERDDSPSSLQLASGAAWHLLARLAAGRHARAAGRVDPVQVAIAHLQDAYASDESVSRMAARVGLSVSHFSTLFRKAAGCGPREYQTRLRMNRSRELLDTTDLSVAAVARAVGYEDPFYFSRQFRKVHGTTASEYRDRAKG
ncbi:helix-turn-helix domain-containing protein [Streptomyces sp. NP160]|uniref:helix-turn-helix transcriptional regulator n=1 Tax=Streptomyces sp. NP160 TaxID=2586637 RepID=UPI001118B02C|nr:helix-turn-helix domain-containing protein [Streptomyces sp. NP160]TNM63164.1 helix-turn-helix domain-containing protein [Streptomyces sp. NP160]